MSYDVVIVGGGPAGLSAALALGRARQRVLLCDSGPRRNAAARLMHNFVTRDGTPPEGFRQLAREQLRTYPNVEVRDVHVEAIGGSSGALRLELGAGASVVARRVLLCTGMIDELLPIDGFAELWGRSIIQCPYCHGWEAQDRPWGYLARAQDAGHLVQFALQALGWTRELVVFTGGALELPEADHERLRAAGIAVKQGALACLLASDGSLTAVELATGERVRCEVLLAHPPQRQVPLVTACGLELDEAGYVRVDPVRGETSRPGIYAAGDLTTRMQGAILAAAMGTRTAAMLNLDLALERAPLG